MIKQFLKPNWRKILLFIILLIFFIGLKRNIRLGDVFFTARGYPLPFQSSNGAIDNLISYIFLFINLIFWYLISCFIIWIYNKLKKKHA